MPNPAGPVCIRGHKSFTTVGMSVTALLMIFYPAISRRLPRKKLMGVLVWVSTVGYAFMLFPGLLLSAGAARMLGMDLKFLLITIGYMLANFGQYGFYLILMISVINTVEYNEYLHGTRDEGIITSLRPFLTKLASALTIAIASGTYTYDTQSKEIVMKLGKVYSYMTMEGTVTATATGVQVLFDANKFLAFAKKAIKVVGAGKDNSTLNTVAKLSDQVTGLQLGFDMVKK